MIIMNLTPFHIAIASDPEWMLFFNSSKEDLSRSLGLGSRDVDSILGSATE